MFFMWNLWNTTKTSPSKIELFTIATTTATGGVPGAIVLMMAYLGSSQVQYTLVFTSLYTFLLVFCMYRWELKRARFHRETAERILQITLESTSRINRARSGSRGYERRLLQ